MEAPATPPAMRADSPACPPPTPLHGWIDSPPRRSQRTTLRKNPYSSANIGASSSFKASSSSMHSGSFTPKASVRKLSVTISDALSTPPQSPMHSRLGSSAARAHDNGCEDDNTNHLSSNNTLAAPTTTTTSLPTPSKTPSLTPARKRQRASSMQDTARILHFQPENPNDVMPTPRQSRKHKVSLANTMGDYDLDVAQPKHNTNAGFQIYTETQARVPQDDPSNGNVFREARSRSIPSAPPAQDRARRWSSSPSPPPRSRKTAQDLQEERRMDAAAARHEGIVYTFRGRKVFKKFESATTASPDPGAGTRQQALKRAAGPAARRPLTRSNIEPRLLWAPRHGERPIDQGDYIPHIDDVDEEAETDIDMCDVQATHEPVPPHARATPVRAKGRTKPMISPPTTGRNTRAPRVDDLPTFDEMLDADDELVMVMPPTPQRSMRKKDNSPSIHEDVNPDSADNNAADSSLMATPARMRAKRVQRNLTPILEGGDEPSSSGLPTSPAVAAGGRRKKSPFDNWPRTKGGKKRENDSLDGGVGGTPSKRSRSVTRSGQA